MHVKSWQTSYRGIMPDEFLANISLTERMEARKKNADRPGIKLVALERLTGSIIAFCDAGVARDPEMAGWGELYGIYVLEEHKREGIGSALFKEARTRLGLLGFSDMYVWVLRENHKARQFYEKMGGALGTEKSVGIGGLPYVEVSYLYRPKDKSSNPLFSKG